MELIMERITDKRALAKAVKEIVLNGDHWDQHVWVSGDLFYAAPDKFDGADGVTATAAGLRAGGAECGTTACVAGWTAVLHAPADAVFVWEEGTVQPSDAEPVWLSRYAREALNLSAGQADWLFAASRSKTEVVAALTALEEGREWDGEAIINSLTIPTET